MKTLDLPQPIVDRLMSLRGRIHAFEEIDPARTAFVVIDLQNVFMAEGALMEVPAARDVVPAVNSIARAARAAGSPVVWVRHVIPADDRWEPFIEHIHSPERGAAVRRALSEGDPAADYWPALEILDGDLLVPKRRFSAFLPGTCGLADILRARGIDTVIIAGTVTNTCCIASALDAMMLDFKVIMVSDACASHTVERHVAALSNFCMVMGDVRSADDTVDLLADGARRRAAAE